MQAESPTPPLKGAKVWPLSVEAYHVLGEAGVIPRNTELLYGFVYTKMPKSPLHAYLTQRLHDALIHDLGTGRLIRSELPIVCQDSEPEPDLSVVRGDTDQYLNEHPRTAELVIEICVTSHSYDRFKLTAYAWAGVKEVWLVLGPEKQIEIYRGANAGEFSQRTVFSLGEVAASSSVPEFRVDLRTLFPK